MSDCFGWGSRQPDILECRVLWQRHSDSIDELRVPVTRVGLFKLAVKRLPAPRRYVGITALSAEVRPSQGRLGSWPFDEILFVIFLFLVVIFLER